MTCPNSSLFYVPLTDNCVKTVSVHDRVFDVNDSNSIEPRGLYVQLLSLWMVLWSIFPNKKKSPSPFRRYEPRIGWAVPRGCEFCRTCTSGWTPASFSPDHPHLSHLIIAAYVCVGAVTGPNLYAEEDSLKSTFFLKKKKGRHQRSSLFPLRFKTCSFNEKTPELPSMRGGIFSSGMHYKMDFGGYRTTTQILVYAYTQLLSSSIDSP